MDDLNLMYKDEVMSPEASLEQNGDSFIENLNSSNQAYCQMNPLLVNNNSSNNSYNNTNVGNGNTPQYQKAPLDLSTKIKIIEECTRNTQTKVAEIFSIHRTTVSKILREKDHLIQLYKGFRISKIQNGNFI